MSDDIFVIAEIGQAHDGSLGILHSFIDALAPTGIDAIKFQTHIAEAESSSSEPFRVPFSYEDKTRYDYWQRMSFSLEQWAGIKQHCEEVSLEFMSSPFSLAAVDLLEKVHIERYKIGSGEVNNYLLLDKVARTGKPIILSSGMSSIQEISDTLDFLKPYGNQLSLLQCTTSYPTKTESLGLNVMSEFKEAFEIPIGFSDHSGNIYAGIAATALGAKILEFHVTFDKRMFGPDSESSISIDQVYELVKGVRYIETSLKNRVDKTQNHEFSDVKRIFGKSLAVNKEMSAGQTITLGDLESKKPKGMGINAKEFRMVIGKKLKKDKKPYDFLRIDEIEGA